MHLFKDALQGALGSIFCLASAQLLIMPGRCGVHQSHSSGKLGELHITSSRLLRAAERGGIVMPTWLVSGRAAISSSYSCAAPPWRPSSGTAASSGARDSTPTNSTTSFSFRASSSS